jgi:hypothetical protein
MWQSRLGSYVALLEMSTTQNGRGWLPRRGAQHMLLIFSGGELLYKLECNISFNQFIRLMKLRNLYVHV